MGGFRGKITVTAVTDSDSGAWSEEDRLIYAGDGDNSWNGAEDNDDYIFRLLETKIAKTVTDFYAKHGGMFYGEPTVHRG